MGGYLYFIKSFPKLSPIASNKLAIQLETKSCNTIDFYTMMAFSASLAPLGLLQNSIPVVIGTMIIAPLMSPLVAAALALAKADARLFKMGIKIAGMGIRFGFAIAMLFGALTQGYELTMEIEARGKPDLMDLGIALISGMTAAYAVSRPDVLNAIAGVAIAAAIIPSIFLCA